jgi:membrane protein YqaA with SNARE-associated domain
VHVRSGCAAGSEFGFERARSLVKIRFHRIQLAQNHVRLFADLQFSSRAARHHHALDVARLPQPRFVVRHGLGFAPLPLVQNGGFIGWIITAFSSPLGVVLLAALDSTLFFSLPFGIDAAVIICAANAHGGFAWAVPFLATIGSTSGAALTFWMGTKIGEKGLDNHVPKKRLARIRSMLKTRGAITLAALDLIPPPFPFTPFVLAAGALKVDTKTMFTTLAICRVIRFGFETYLARKYGKQIVGWMDSDLFRKGIIVLIILAVIASALSIIKVVLATREPARRRAAA